MKICMKGYSEAVEPIVFTSVAEPEPHLLVRAGAPAPTAPALTMVLNMVRN
jgi:hypothetical protein